MDNLSKITKFSSFYLESAQKLQRFSRKFVGVYKDKENVEKVLIFIKK